MPRSLRPSRSSRKQITALERDPEPWEVSWLHGSMKRNPEKHARAQSHTQRPHVPSPSSISPPQPSLQSRLPSRPPILPPRPPILPSQPLSLHLPQQSVNPQTLFRGLSEAQKQVALQWSATHALPSIISPTAQTEKLSHHTVVPPLATQTDIHLGHQDEDEDQGLQDPVSQSQQDEDEDQGLQDPVSQSQQEGMEAQVGREDNESFQHSYVLQLWELINFPHVPTPLSICSWVFRPKKSSDSPDAKRNVLVLSDASQQYTSLNFSPLYFEKILEGTVNTLLRLHAIEDGDETSAVFSTSVLQSPPSLPTPVNDSRSLEAIVNCPSCFFDVRVNAGSDGAKSKRSIDYLLGKFVLHVEENHHSICPPSSPLTCPFKACGRCRYTFKTKQGLMQHLTSVHLQQWGQATGVQPSVTYAIRGQSFFSRPMEMNYACDVLSQTPAILNTFEGRDERVERQFTMTVVANLWPIRSKGPTPNLVLVGEDSFGTDVGGWRALCAKVPRFEVTVLNQQYQHLHHLHSSLPLSHTINYSVDRYCSKKLLAAADIVLSPPTTISHNDELNRHVNFMRRLRSMVVEK